MKNSLSKSLLCGIIASTFIMVNCQKAPSRGVKAQQGAGATAENKLEGKVIVECSKDFPKLFNEAFVLFKKLNEASLENLDDEQKKSLENLMTDFSQKTKVVIDDIKKVQANADGCVVTDKDTKKASDPYPIESIQKQADDLILRINQKTGITTADTVKAENNRKARNQKSMESSLEQGTELIVSDELAKILIPANKEGAVYFANGSIVKNSTNYDTMKADKTKTLCVLTDISDEQKTLKASDKVLVVGLTATKDNARQVVTMILGLGDLMHTFRCSIADNKVNAVKSEIRKAFGKNLQTQKEIDLVQAKNEEIEKQKAVEQKRAEAQEQFLKSEKEAYNEVKKEEVKKEEPKKLEVKKIEEKKPEEKKPETAAKPADEAEGEPFSFPI